MAPSSLVCPRIKASRLGRNRPAGYSRMRRALYGGVPFVASPPFGAPTSHPCGNQRLALVSGSLHFSVSWKGVRGGPSVCEPCPAPPLAPLLLSVSPRASDGSVSCGQAFWSRLSLFAHSSTSRLGRNCGFVIALLINLVSRRSFRFLNQPAPRANARDAPGVSYAILCLRPCWSVHM